MAAYLDYLMGTVGAYNKTVKQKLLNMIVHKGIATLEDNVTLFGEDVSLGCVPQDVRLITCLQNSARAVKAAELFEFVKSYRYSVAMKVNEPIKDEKIAALSSSGTIVEFNEEEVDSNDTFGTSTEPPHCPCYINSTNECCFKLCFTIDKFDAEGNAINRKFSVLVVAHKDSNLVEVRYDSISSHISNDNSFYLTYINIAIKWIEKVLELTITDKDAPSERMHYIVENREALRVSGEAIIIGQGMKFGNGSSADLFVGTSESGVLPLIGELRQFLSDNEDAFNEAPAIKEALEDFLSEKEKDSDWPWLSLRLTYKKKKIEIKYTTEMYGMGMCRIMFIENTKYDAEAMSYAIKYITESNSNNPAVEFIGTR